MKHEYYKYLIVGGGLSGKLMALGLASQGIQCALLDRDPEKHFSDPRTIALNSNAIDALQDYKILNILRPHMSNIHDIYVVDDQDDLHMLHFSKTHNQDKPIGHMILSSDFNRILWNAVIQNANITVITGEYIDVTTDGVQATVTLTHDRQLSTSLLIAADGVRSAIAAKFFHKKVSKQYGQAALTFLIAHSNPHHNMAMEHFMPSGPFATLPLREPNQSSIVWCDTLSALQHYISLSPAELSRYLEQRIGPVLGDVRPLSDLSNSYCFPLTANITNKYYHHNIVLVADAAHNIHPLAGQGLNQGIKDIVSLISIIGNAEYCGLDMTQIMLQKYERERALDNYLMYQLTDKLSKLFSNNIPITKLLRRTGLSLLDSVGPLKQIMLKYAKGN